MFANGAIQQGMDHAIGIPDVKVMKGQNFSGRCFQTAT